MSLRPLQSDISLIPIPVTMRMSQLAQSLDSVSLPTTFPHSGPSKSPCYYRFTDSCLTIFFLISGFLISCDFSIFYYVDNKQLDCAVFWPFTVITVEAPITRNANWRSCIICLYLMVTTKCMGMNFSLWFKTWSSPWVNVYMVLCLNCANKLLHPTR